MEEGRRVLGLLESMEKHWLELESEAFSKATAKAARGNPY